MGWVKRAKLRIKNLVTDIHSISTREVIRMHMRLRNPNELGEARATADNEDEDAAVAGPAGLRVVSLHPCGGY